MLFFQNVQNTKPFCFMSKYFIKIILSCFIFSQLYISSLQRVYIQKGRSFHNNSILTFLPKKENRTNTFSLTFKSVCKNTLYKDCKPAGQSRYFWKEIWDIPQLNGHNRRKWHLLITCNLGQQLSLFHWVKMAFRYFRFPKKHLPSLGKKKTSVQITPSLIVSLLERFQILSMS